MSLTGTGIRIGTATQFGQGIRFPRALASDGTQLILFDSSKGHQLDAATGIATPIGSITQFGRSESQCRSATYHNNQFVFWGNSRKTIYNYDPTDGSTSDAHGNPLTIQNTNTNPDLWGLTSLNGTLWALDRPSAKLYTVDLPNNQIIPVGDATDYGLVGSPNIQGFGAYKGELLGVSTGLDQLVRFDQMTGVATLVTANSLPDASSEALSEHAGQLLMLGSSADALFRLYDVLWDETIVDLEVNEGESAAWNLASVSQDAALFSLPGNTRSWLSISGTDLVATTAPDVFADQNNDVAVRAARDGINVDKTLRVVVRNLAPAVATFSITTADTDIREGESVDFTIISNIAITGFILTDIAVTGGTANSLSASGTNTWTLNVTAGSGTGTLNIAIAENAVLPGNSAFSQDFTRTALPTVDIEFPVAELVGGVATTAVLVWSEDITGLGFDTDDITISVGIKGAFTITGARTATLVVTAPPGSGSMVFTIRQNAISIGNAEYTESINYAPPPADALSFGSETIANQALVVGTAVSLTLPSATGGTGAKTYSLSPTLPAGMTFDATTRVLSGTPTGRFTSATFTYTVTDADNDTLSLTFTIVVTATAITFSPTSFANQILTVGTAIALTLPEGAGGVGDLTASLTGTLPTGITFTASTRALAGNPSATFASASFTYTMTDDEGESESITFTIIVNAEALSFDGNTIADQVWVDGTTIASFTLPEASGGDGTKTYSLSPALPSGITFTASTRSLSGTLTEVFTLTTFTYTVTDSDSNTLDLTFTIVVTAAVTAEAGYFLDLGILAGANYENAKLPVVIVNEDGDDVIALRIPRIMAQALLVTATRIVSVLEGLSDDQKSAIKTALDIIALRDADATYTLIQSLLNYQDLSNKPTTITQAQATKLAGVNYHEWTPTISGLATGESVDMIEGNAFEMGNGVKFDAKFRVRNSEIWTLMKPRLSLPVASSSPSRMIGGGQGYGGSEQKFLETLGSEHIDIGAMSGAGTVRDITVLNGTLYAIDDNDDIYSVNRTTGASTLVNNNLQVGTPYSMVAHNGDLWVSGSTGLFRLDGNNLATDTGTERGNLSFGASESLLSFNGNLYQWERNDDYWYQINTSSGARTRVGQQGMGVGISEVYSATVKDGKVFMLARSGSDEIYCFTDITGTAQQFGDFSVSVDSIAWHEGDQRMYYEDGNNLEYLDLYDPPIMSANFAGDNYTTAIAQCEEQSNLIQVNIEKLQRNDSDAFISISGSYKK